MDYFLPGFFIWVFIRILLRDLDDRIAVGGLSLLAYYSAKFFLPASDLYQYVLSTVIGIFMAQYIYQMHGMFEMHFFAFIGSTILVLTGNGNCRSIAIVYLYTTPDLVLQFIGWTKYLYQLDT